MDVEKNKTFLEQVEKHFSIGKIKRVTAISTGNVNSTYKVETEGATYILQRINKFAFKKPEEVMQNIISVSNFLKDKVSEESGNSKESGDSKRKVLHPIDTLDEKGFLVDSESEYWRVYDSIEGAVTHDTVDNEEMFKKVGQAFGQFQNRLIDYPARTLHEAIPDFHNTPKRYIDFMKAIKDDKVGRYEAIKQQPDHSLNKAIMYILGHVHELNLIEEGKKTGKLPIRVTHNDTKINNVMIDEKTGEPVCVIDFDTIGPDSCLVDFGDAIRSGANREGEEPSDYKAANLCIKLYEAYTKGYLSQTLVLDKNGKLNQEPQKGLIESEIQLLYKAPKILTLELAMRFLGDYLNGDEYFQKKDGQPEDINLLRGLTQFYLAIDMEKKENEMKRIVETIVAEKIRAEKAKETQER